MLGVGHYSSLKGPLVLVARTTVNCCSVLWCLGQVLGYGGIARKLSLETRLCLYSTLLGYDIRLCGRVASNSGRPKEN